jgi:hypothetical protein
MPGARQDEGRKIIMKRLVRGEKGYVLIAALMVLLVLGLISGPLLSYMVSGLKAGHVFETGAAELYGADSGVTYALWKIKEDQLCPGMLPQVYNINVNGKDVVVTIEIDNGTYKVTSTAITDGGGNTADLGSYTTVESYVGVTTQSMNFFDNAITSDGSIVIKPGTVVNGTVQCPEGSLSNQGTINGQTINAAYPNWPDATDLSNHYLSQVQNAPDPGSSININNLNPKTIGPCYRNGSLTIDNSKNPATLILQGTVYVAGDLNFAQAGSNNYSIDLNGQTIFATGRITFPSVSQGQTPHVSIAGSGCIIAVGNIDFQPAISSQSGDFIFVMSIDGTVAFKPSGTFYGSLAGDAEVYLSPNNQLIWNPPPGEGTGLNFPIDQYSGGEIVMGATITSYNVSRQ